MPVGTIIERQTLNRYSKGIEDLDDAAFIGEAVASSFACDGDTGTESLMHDFHVRSNDSVSARLKNDALEGESDTDSHPVRRKNFRACVGKFNKRILITLW